MFEGFVGFRAEGFEHELVHSSDFKVQGFSSQKTLSLGLLLPSPLLKP